MFKGAIAAIALLSLVGCSTMRTVSASDAASVQSRVQAGDAVRVKTLDGRSFELTVIAVAADALRGEDDSGKRWKIPYAQIERLEVKSVSGWKTAGAVALGIGVAAITLFVVGAHAFAEGLEGD